MDANLANTPVPASTVLLVRDTKAVFEVFMVTRNQKIDFAYGALVFPGGKLDAEDSNIKLLQSCGEQGYNQEELSARICGIRETFEEAGILLARDLASGEMINGERSLKLAKLYRKALHDGSVTLLEILKNENLILACDQLILFARWVTPKFFSRRFDASFFIALAPDDQIASHDNVESVNSLWTVPADILKKADDGHATIVFATRMNLQKLAQYKTVDDLRSDTLANEVFTVEPEFQDDGGRVTYTIPIEAGYGITQYTEYGGPSLKIKSQT